MDQFTRNDSPSNNWQSPSPAILQPPISLVTPFPTYSSTRHGIPYDSASSGSSTLYNRSVSPAVSTKRSIHDECLVRISELEAERSRLLEQILQKNELINQKNETIITLQSAALNNRAITMNSVPGGNSLGQGKLTSSLTLMSNPELTSYVQLLIQHLY